MSRITRKPLRKHNKSVADDVDEADIEDIEIRRLEKLLKIDSKKRKISAEKLNKEFEENEGIDGNFGDFLLGLDDLSNGIVKYKKSSNHTNQDEVRYDSTLINDESDDERELNEEGALESDSKSSQTASEEEEDAEEESSRQASDKINAHEVYQPVPGQDIYGRITDASKASHSTAKYVPPAKRKLVSDDTVRPILSN